MNPDIWYVYLAECADGSLYTGIATDVPRRIAEHNSGKGARYTRGRRPVRPVYTERCRGRSEALRREHEIKKMRSDMKWRLVR
ncbi:MAG: GIY-YIG nuclease family protein, partial [Gammaproteobacteria bacterium]